MSEITTGAVSLSAIGAPLAVGAACISAINYAAKFCNDRYGNLIEEIEATDKRLKWLNTQVISSPKQLESEAKCLQNIVSSTNAFHLMTTGMSDAEKKSLSGIIAIQHSPLSSYIAPLMNEIPAAKTDFDESLRQAVKNLASDNLRYVNGIVKDAAKAAGFDRGVKILRQNERILDIVFEDEKSRRFTAYCKLDKELNPSLALDLEGFSCDDKECSQKMEEIVQYLLKHGLPFHYQRLKHSQPQGVLRNLLRKNELAVKTDTESWLQSGNLVSKSNKQQGI